MNNSMEFCSIIITSSYLQKNQHKTKKSHYYFCQLKEKLAKLATTVIIYYQRNPILIKTENQKLSKYFSVHKFIIIIVLKFKTRPLLKF